MFKGLVILNIILAIGFVGCSVMTYAYINESKLFSLLSSLAAVIMGVALTQLINLMLTIA